MCGYAALSFYRAGRTLSGVSLTGKAQSSAVSLSLSLSFLRVVLERFECDVRESMLYGESLSKLIEIQVYCTSKDATETDETLQMKSGALRLHRPDFETQAPLMTEVTRDYWEGRPKFTSSLVIFCGSARLGSISNAVFNAKMAFKIFTGSNHVLFHGRKLLRPCEADKIAWRVYND